MTSFFCVFIVIINFSLISSTLTQPFTNTLLPYEMNRFCGGLFNETYTIFNGYGIGAGYITSSFSMPQVDLESTDIYNDTLWEENKNINNPLNTEFIYYYGQECAQTDDYLYAVPSRIYGNYGKYLFIYDLSNDMYLDIDIYDSILPISTHGSCICIYDNFIYVIGGQNGNGGEYINNTQKYSADNDTWMQKTGINIPRYRHGCVAVNISNPTIYIFGGYDGNYLKSIEKYDIYNDAWSTLSETLWITRRLLQCVHFNEDIFIFCVGGEYFDGQFVTPKLIEVFNIYNESVVSVDFNISLHDARYSHAIIPQDNFVVIMGGKDDTGNYLDSIELLTYNEFPIQYQPTQSPTVEPTHLPSIEPTIEPTNIPTNIPTYIPSNVPTNIPSDIPTNVPTFIPTNIPSNIPSDNPTAGPTIETTKKTTEVSTDVTNDESVATESIDSTGDSVDNAADGLNISDFELDTLLQVIIGIVALLLLITICAFIHKKGLLPCCFPSDDALIGTVLIYGLQVWDFFSDSKFAYELGSDYGIDNEINLLFQLSIIFLVMPWLFNILLIFYQRRKWIRHAIVNAWIRDYAALLMGLTMISGGANAVIQLCNSNLFGLKLFQMNLPRHEMIKMSKYPILLSSLLENVPQIAIQYTYLTSDFANNNSNSSSTTSSAFFALLSSSLALLFSFGVLILRVTDPLDDIPFCIVCKLNSNEDIISIRKNLGYRLKIGQYIAQSLEVGDELVKVDKITIGVQKLLVYVSITSPVVRQINSSLNRHKSILNRMKSHKNEMNEKNVDLWINKLLSAKHNGSLPNNLKKSILLKHLPIIDNIYHDDDNSLQKHLILQKNDDIIVKTDTNTFNMLHSNDNTNNNNNNNNYGEINDEYDGANTTQNTQNTQNIVNINGNNDKEMEMMYINNNTSDPDKLNYQEPTLPKPVSIIHGNVTAGGDYQNTSDDSSSSDEYGIPPMNLMIKNTAGGESYAL